MTTGLEFNDIDVEYVKITQYSTDLTNCLMCVPVYNTSSLYLQHIYKWVDDPKNEPQTIKAYDAYLSVIKLNSLPTKISFSYLS